MSHSIIHDKNENNSAPQCRGSCVSSLRHDFEKRLDILLELQKRIKRHSKLFLTSFILYDITCLHEVLFGDDEIRIKADIPTVRVIHLLDERKCIGAFYDIYTGIYETFGKVLEYPPQCLYLKSLSQIKAMGFTA